MLIDDSLNGSFHYYANDINIVSDESSDYDFDCNGQCLRGIINMISKQESFLIDIIENVENPEVQKRIFTKIKGFNY